MSSLSEKLTTLTTPSGNASVTIANLGATVTEYTVDGLRVILGFPNVSDYLRSDNPYCGATIGRISNRIANAEISLPLAGKASHQLPSNDAYAKKGASCLHGGPEGFHQK
jgi:aldose 1-epimerase